jgi:uncharacterized protein YoxC
VNGKIVFVYIVLTLLFILYTIYIISVYKKMANNVDNLKVELAKASFRVYLLEKKEKIFREQSK